MGSHRRLFPARCKGGGMRTRQWSRSVLGVGSAFLAALLILHGNPGVAVAQAQLPDLTILSLAMDSECRIRITMRNEGPGPLAADVFSNPPVLGFWFERGHEGAVGCGLADAARSSGSRRHCHGYDRPSPIVIGKCASESGRQRADSRSPGRQQHAHADPHLRHATARRCSNEPGPRHAMPARGDAHKRWDDTPTGWRVWQSILRAVL